MLQSQRTCSWGASAFLLGVVMAAVRRQFDGLLNFFKPAGITSAKALYRVRSLTGIRKSGHAGTLDPAADGVLLLCMGKVTKRVEALMNLPKVYRAVGRLDVTSKSFDSDAPHEPVEVRAIPTEEQVRLAAAEFQGPIEQVPPAVSALKVKGLRAYKMARRNQEISLEPRIVHIYRMTVLRYDWPEVEFEVACGRGTYIRALIRDLGQKLGTGGCLTSLTRTAVGPFTVQQATRFEELEQGLFEQRRTPLEVLDALLKAFLSSHAADRC